MFFRPTKVRSDYIRIFKKHMFVSSVDGLYHSKLNSGGIVLGLDGANMTNLESSLFCSAWMIPVVDDAEETPSLLFEEVKKTVTVTTGTSPTEIEVKIPCLTSNNLAKCNVRVYGDAHYAVLKRGLL